MINIIVAVDNKYGIAKNGNLPWRIKEDLRYCSKITRKTKDPHKMNAVIMGRKTWQSLPSGLKNRVNIVLSRKITIDELYDNELYDDNVTCEACTIARSLDEAIQVCNKDNLVENIFVIGGTNVYKEALDRNLVNKIYLTRIDKDYECDTFFPYESFLKCMMTNKCKEKKQVVTIKNKDISQLTYCEYDIEIERRNDGEYQYLNLLRKIMSEGNLRQTRNAETYSIFEEILQFDLAKGFPLLTTKRMWWREIVRELFFFLRGNTNTKNLKIWKKNTTREFLDKVGLSHYAVFDMGPMYGFNWRHFGAEYKGMDHDYTGKGDDQLRGILELLKNDPTSRRIMMSTFDPSNAKKGCLYPCHGLNTQFYVRNGFLDCATICRSQDVVLGTPFNIASYALLVYIIAHVTGYKPGILTMECRDCHIYNKSDHLLAAKEQLGRIPFKFPKLFINKKIDSELTIDAMLKYIENLNYKDITLVKYVHHDPIKVVMIE